MNRRLDGNMTLIGRVSLLEARIRRPSQRLESSVLASPDVEMRNAATVPVRVCSLDGVPVRLRRQIGKKVDE